MNARLRMRTGALVAIVALAGAGLAGCSGGSERTAAEPAASDSMQGSNVRPDAPPLTIMQADNGTTVNLVPGQVGCFGDLPKDNYNVATSDDAVVDGASGLTGDDGVTCSPAVLAMDLGTAQIVVSDSSGQPVLQFSVEVIPAD